MLHRELIRSIEEGNQLVSRQDEVRAELARNPRSIVILDDDPTGTQTVHNVPVITHWSKEALENELLRSPVFFILTNSRSLQEQSAIDLARKIGERLRELATIHQKDILVISRSDSTLRGHYPTEVDALIDGLGWKNTKVILSPAFLEGGRYTFKNIHYVKEGNAFVPAGETPFAKDNTFGYRSSDLEQWIMEKSMGNLDKEGIQSISLALLRENTVAQVIAFLENPKASHFVVNATSKNDLEQLALACLRAKGCFLYRTAASFVNAITGIAHRELLTKYEVLEGQNPGGALVVIGSYVPITSAQLNFLKNHSSAFFYEVDVSKVMDTSRFTQEIDQLIEKIDRKIKFNSDVVVYTSREVVKGATKSESLEIVNKVSNGLITIVQQLQHRPKYILAKGGITSSDVATKGLSVQRAEILGQVCKGVPVWRLGQEAKFPGLPYVVFPGNVGEPDTLHGLMELLN